MIVYHKSNPSQSSNPLLPPVVWFMGKSAFPGVKGLEDFCGERAMRFFADFVNNFPRTWQEVVARAGWRETEK
jgi:hypothetical protein